MSRSETEQIIVNKIYMPNKPDFMDKQRMPSKEVDSFEIEEIKTILDWMDKHHPSMTAFFAVAFYTGMRTGEIMALKWGDIDFKKHSICVRRNVYKGMVKESTKTATNRTIDIIPALDEYITKQKALTFMKSEWMFIKRNNSIYGHTSELAATLWIPCLKALGLRHRVLYQTRHTFACLWNGLDNHPH